MNGSCQRHACMLASHPTLVPSELIGGLRWYRLSPWSECAFRGMLAAEVPIVPRPCPVTLGLFEKALLHHHRLFPKSSKKTYAHSPKSG